MRCASLRESAPNFRRSKFCSRQSSRESRTLETTRKPSTCQSSNETSLAERGAAEVTADTTASPKSNQSTSTGRILDALPSVNGISASQISPGNGIVVKPFVARSVAVQKSGMVAGILLFPLAVNPRGQFRKIFGRKLLNGAFDFLNSAHAEKLQLPSFSASGNCHSKIAGSP